MKKKKTKTDAKTTDLLTGALTEEQRANSADFQRFIAEVEICPTLTRLLAYWWTLEDGELPLKFKQHIALTDWLREEEKEVKSASEFAGQFHELMDYLYLVLHVHDLAEFISCSEKLTHMVYISTRFRAAANQPFRPLHGLKIDHSLLSEWLSSQQSRSRKLHFESAFFCAEILYCLANIFERRTEDIIWSRIGEPRWDFFVNDEGDICFRG